ncbi:MAG: hypothetical protein MK135_16635, partial [Polyangiaceae bacterium]|nr:hypothetical protein [Polyangiaceae bacterium]
HLHQQPGKKKNHATFQKPPTKAVVVLKSHAPAAEAAAQKRVAKIYEQQFEKLGGEKGLSDPGFDVAGLGRKTADSEERLVLGEVKYSQGRRVRNEDGTTSEFRDRAIPASKVTATTDNLGQNLTEMLASDDLSGDQSVRVEGAIRQGRMDMPLYTGGKAKFTPEQIEKVKDKTRAALREFLTNTFEDLTSDEIDAAVQRVRFPSVESVT